MQPPFASTFEQSCRSRCAAWLLAILFSVPTATALGQATQDSLPDSIGERIRFETPSGTLSGNFLLPAGPGPHPAVVMIEGSGPWSFRRDWVSRSVWPMWRLLTEALLARGVAVMLFDKPGIGSSSGDWRKQSFEDRADDVLAAVRVLRKRPEIDGRRVGILGHSQGGYVAPVAAVRGRDDVAFLISLAGPAVSVSRQIEDDRRSAWECAGNGAASKAIKHTGLHAWLWAYRGISSVVQPGYLGRILRHEPAEYLGKLTQPSLALFAGNDRLVPAGSNAERWRAATPHSGDSIHFVVTVPNVTHAFRTAPRCPARGDVRESELAPAVLDALEHRAFWARVGVVLK